MRKTELLLLFQKKPVQFVFKKNVISSLLQKGTARVQRAERQATQQQQQQLSLSAKTTLGRHPAVSCPSFAMISLS